MTFNDGTAKQSFRCCCYCCCGCWVADACCINFFASFSLNKQQNADTMQASFALVHRKRWGLSSRVWIIRSPTKTHSELWVSYLSRDDLLCQYFRGQSLLHNHRFFIIVVRRNGICVCFCLCVFGCVCVMCVWVCMCMANETSQQPFSIRIISLSASCSNICLKGLGNNNTNQPLAIRFASMPGRKLGNFPKMLFRLSWPWLNLHNQFRLAWSVCSAKSKCNEKNCSHSKANIAKSNAKRRDARQHNHPARSFAMLKANKNTNFLFSSLHSLRPRHRGPRLL